jgi:hypothetical protein
MLWVVLILWCQSRLADTIVYQQPIFAPTYQGMSAMRNLLPLLNAQHRLGSGLGHCCSIRKHEYFPIFPSCERSPRRQLSLKAQLTVDADIKTEIYHQWTWMRLPLSFTWSLVTAKILLSMASQSPRATQTCDTHSIDSPNTFDQDTRVEHLDSQWHVPHHSLTTLGRAAWRMPSKTTQMVKLLYGLLPTAVIVHHYDPKLPTSCR